jgi:hypothetical protein
MSSSLYKFIGLTTRRSIQKEVISDSNRENQFLSEERDMGVYMIDL